jgi:hypothetical protein
VGNLFELQDLGVQDLKGISGPVRAWAALRSATVDCKFVPIYWLRQATIWRAISFIPRATTGLNN